MFEVGTITIDQDDELDANQTMMMAFFKGFDNIHATYIDFNAKEETFIFFQEDRFIFTNKDGFMDVLSKGMNLETVKSVVNDAIACKESLIFNAETGAILNIDFESVAKQNAETGLLGANFEEAVAKQKETKKTT